jgi:hypothetical protein
MAEPRIGPCVGKVGNFIAIGLNYSDHAAESGMPVPEEPIIFNKAPTCICGPNDDTMIPKHGSQQGVLGRSGARRTPKFPTVIKSLPDLLPSRIYRESIRNLCPKYLGGLTRSTQHFISDARDGVDGDGAKIWSRLRDCVRKGGIQLNHQGITDFACNIESSIVTFLKTRADTSGRRRQAHMRFATCGNQTLTFPNDLICLNAIPTSQAATLKG